MTVVRPRAGRHKRFRRTSAVSLGNSGVVAESTRGRANSCRFLYGWTIVELQIGNLWEVKRWLIGWGGSAEVLMPSTLKEGILSEYQKIIAMEN
jgi:hypothetical protein